jgi:prepilin-type N-terminal cleavage/methylation domain-containing protein
VRHPSRDSGFTIVEVTVAVVLLGLMMAIAVLGFSRYSNAHEQAGTARSLQSGLRQAQQRAVTEGRAMCVQFSATSYTVWRTACTTAGGGTQLEGPTTTESAEVHLALPAPQTLTFTPRGTATWGSIASDVTVAACGGVKAFQVTVTRASSSKVYRLCIAALTGRVDLHG